MPGPFNETLMVENPLAALADAYFSNIPDAFRRPNTLLYEWLERTVDERAIRGILFLYYPWCDTWHAEARRVKETSPVPMLTLCLSDDDTSDGHAVSRIEAFMEMLT